MSIIMIKTKPSAGPYRLDIRREFQIRGRYDHPIAKLAHGDTTEQTQANGNLLAASWVVLDALEKLVGCAGITSLPGYEKELDDAMRNAHEAIAKARGEA